MEDQNEREMERSTFISDHSAEYDQRAKELADKLQLADGFIAFTYTRKDENTMEGHAMAGAVPGCHTNDFIIQAARCLNTVFRDLLSAVKEESEIDDETEG